MSRAPAPPSGVLRLSELSDPGARAGAVERAAESLRRGRLVLLPTETVYGISALASNAAALDALRRVRSTGGPEVGSSLLGWHAPSVEEVAARLPLRSAAHRRLVGRLAPGPVTFLVECDEVELRAVRAALGAGEGAGAGAGAGAGVAPGILDDGAAVLVRVPDHAFTHAVLARAPGAVAAAWVPGPGGAPARTVEEAEGALRSAGGEGVLVIDDGPSPLGRLSTRVRLRRDGGVRVERAGAYEERFIMKQLVRTVLFVCTGNTCRSPMAAAIARSALQRDGPSGPGAVEVRVRSAGIAASDGAPATPETAHALQSLGIEGGRHASSQLTREMLHEADVVYAMTGAQRAAISRPQRRTNWS